MKLCLKYIRLEFKAADCWIGAFWKATYITPVVTETDLWICLLPMLPVHFKWRCIKEYDGQ